MTIKILLRDSNYLVDLVIWPKFGNSSISTTEVIFTFIFEGWPCFKFNNLGHVVGMIFEFLQQCDKKVKTKNQKVLKAHPTFTQFTGKTC